MKKYLSFLLISYVVAFLFELNAALFFDGGLLSLPILTLIPVFLIWYGFIYSATFLVYRNKSLWYPVITWAILGPIAEIFIFKRINWIVDPIIYAIMFFIPFLVYHKYIKKWK